MAEGHQEAVKRVNETWQDVRVHGAQKYRTGKNEIWLDGILKTARKQLGINNSCLQDCYFELLEAILKQKTQPEHIVMPARSERNGGFWTKFSPPQKARRNIKNQIVPDSRGWNVPGSCSTPYRIFDFPCHSLQEIIRNIDRGDPKYAAPVCLVGHKQQGDGIPASPWHTNDRRCSHPRLDSTWQGDEQCGQSQQENRAKAETRANPREENEPKEYPSLGPVTIFFKNRCVGKIKWNQNNVSSQSR